MSFLLGLPILGAMLNFRGILHNLGDPIINSWDTHPARQGSQGTQPCQELLCGRTFFFEAMSLATPTPCTKRLEKKYKQFPYIEIKEISSVYKEYYHKLILY